MDNPSPKLIPGKVTREVLLSMPKETAIAQLGELYAADPRPFFQAFADEPGSLEAVYYGILTGED